MDEPVGYIAIPRIASTLPRKRSGSGYVVLNREVVFLNPLPSNTLRGGDCPRIHDAAGELLAKKPWYNTLLPYVGTCRITIVPLRLVVVMTSRPGTLRLHGARRYDDTISYTLLVVFYVSICLAAHRAVGRANCGG